MEELEGSLLRLEARLDEVLERLLSRRRRLTAHNATVLVLLEGVTGQTAGCVVRRAVPDLRTRADAGLLAARLYVVAAVIAVLTGNIYVRHNGFYLNRRFFSNEEQVLSLYTPALRTIFSIHVSNSANSSVGSRERACCKEIDDR